MHTSVSSNFVTPIPEILQGHTTENEILSCAPQIPLGTALGDVVGDALKDPFRSSPHQ
jgi:hypothetical protein